MPETGPWVTWQTAGLLPQNCSEEQVNTEQGNPFVIGRITFGDFSYHSPSNGQGMLRNNWRPIFYICETVKRPITFISITLGLLNIAMQMKNNRIQGTVLKSHKSLYMHEKKVWHRDTNWDLSLTPEEFIVIWKESPVCELLLLIHLLENIIRLGVWNQHLG